ncbi:lysozyme [bacterium]|nr:lysozyme [bacterium]
MSDLHDQLIEKHSWDGHINEAGLSIIKTFEGFSEAPYLCPAGIPTIGYGSTWDQEGNRVTMEHPNITESGGQRLLDREVRHTELAVNSLILVALNENQFSALCSFTYNLGSGNLQSSTLRAKLNRGDYEGASAEFPKWRRAGGRILKGLVRRRAIERELFDG